MEIDQLKYGKVSSLDVMEMETLLKESPWFSYLRHRLMEKLYRLDPEAFSQILASNAVFLASRKALYQKITSPESEEETEVFLKEETEEIHRPKVIVAGGDFFSKDDLKSIDPEDDMELKLRNSPFTRKAEESSPTAEDQKQSSPAKGKTSMLTEDGKVNFDDLAFYTETLGHIYAQQGFYDKAIDVFSKLILLYPQKSAYFAALVNDLKKNLE